MQQPVANRWLSPELLRYAEPAGVEAARRLVAPEALLEGLEPGLEPIAANPAPVRLPEDDHGRRVVLSITAGMLLLASIAFSYLAWSDTGNAAEPLATGITTPTHLATTGAEARERPETVPALRTDAEAIRQQIQTRVHDQRVLNAELRERIAALRDDLANP